MVERIAGLTEMTLRGEMNVPRVAVEYDRSDILLPRSEREVKRLCEYIAAQEPRITEWSALTGFFNFDGSCVGDAFRRMGHTATQAAMAEYYRKPVENLSTMEWQHATADYQKVLTVGIRGIIDEIDDSIGKHWKPEELDFLHGLKKSAEAMIAWARKCAERVGEFAGTVADPEAQRRLSGLRDALTRVPENPPSSFYEAVLTIYICFSADPDSVGTLDRYLEPFYRADLQKGSITPALARDYLQELFLMLQAATKVSSENFTRGGESHFCVGGYLPNGEDAFTDFSKLMIEALMDLPTYIPQVTLRWTAKTPREVFRFMMDCERKDPFKRIAFTNDEKRIRSYTEICRFPFEKAVSYTTVGCNEPAILGAIAGSSSHLNILRSIERMFRENRGKLGEYSSFEDFYADFEELLYSDLARAYAYDDSFNLARAGDVNYISSLFFNDCVGNAKSLTQGGGNTAICSPELCGIPNLIDSLIVVRQFVFEEKKITLPELAAALDADWVGYEDLRRLILRTAHFFGNDDPLSNEVARRLYESFYQFLRDRKNVFGYPILIGDLNGYGEHPKWFGTGMMATPDGRRAGEALKFGIGQSEGKDREGLTALINAIAGVDPHAIACGSTVTNFTIDETMVRDDRQFEKTVDLFETYFRKGGVQFQLNYVSSEELKQAKQKPEEHQSLRVRVTGFSEYFVKLPECLQDDVIARTEQKC